MINFHIIVEIQFMRNFMTFFSYSINSTTFYMNMILFDNQHISLYNIKINSKSLFSNKTIDLIKNANYYSHRYLFYAL